MGFWTDKGKADADTLDFLQQLHGKRVFLFGTAGFGGSAPYFEKILAATRKALDGSNTVIGSFMSQGKMPVSVYATLSNVTNEEVDDGFTATFKFDNDLVFTVEVGTSNFINLPRWYVEGLNGTAVIDDFQVNGKIVIATADEEHDAVPIVTAAGLTKTMAPRTPETISELPLPRIDCDIHDYYRNIAAVVNGEAEQIVTHDQQRQLMKLMEAIFESAEKNQVVYF